MWVCVCVCVGVFVCVRVCVTVLDEAGPPPPCPPYQLSASELFPREYKDICYNDFNVLSKCFSVGCGWAGEV